MRAAIRHFRYRQKRNSRSATSAYGFSLVEVLIAVFAVGMITVLCGAAASTLTLSRTAQYQDVALHGANQQLETLRATGYAALPASGAFTNADLAQLPDGAGTTTVSAYNDTTKQVVVTVSWQDGSTTPHTISLSTLIAQAGGLP